MIPSCKVGHNRWSNFYLGIRSTFLKIFSNNIVSARKTETCMGTSSGSVDASLYISWSLGVGWATMGGGFKFLHRNIKRNSLKSSSQKPVSQKSSNWWRSIPRYGRFKFVQTMIPRGMVGQKWGGVHFCKSIKLSQKLKFFLLFQIGYKKEAHKKILL